MTLVVCFLSFHYVLVYLLNFHYILVYLLNYEFVDVWFLSQLYLKLSPGFNSILVPPLTLCADLTTGHTCLLIFTPSPPSPVNPRVSFSSSPLFFPSEF